MLVKYQVIRSPIELLVAQGTSLLSIDLVYSIPDGVPVLQSCILGHDRVSDLFIAHHKLLLRWSRHLNLIIYS
jgi:hypothetical protein